MTAPLNPPLRPSVLRPTVRFMLSHPAHWVALGFGAGLSPIAPGTAGTSWAWLVYLLLQHWLSPQAIALVIAVSLVVGWWACTVTAGHMRVLDPGPIVWDEVVAFWIILWLVMPAGFWGQFAAFALFRLFDSIKPGPVAWADDLFHDFGWRGGFGIILDDLVAAFCTLLVIAGLEVLVNSVEQLAQLMRARHWMLATAESCTGGMIAAACTDLAGSSQWFERGFVSYSNDAKTELLGVDPGLLQQHGAVSEPVVRAMARGAVQHARAQVAVAVTGVAGPTGGTREKPVGTVWFAFMVNGELTSEVRQFAGDRAAVREATVRQAVDGLLLRLQRAR